MFGNKARRRPHVGSPVQVLESRALLAASATLNAATGQLTIQGTSGNDKLYLGSGSGNSQVNLLEGGRIVSGPFQISQIKSISANLMSGLDDLTIDLKGRTLTRVDVFFGTGGWERNPERLNLFGGTVGDLYVDAKASSTTAVQLKNLSVTKTANLQYGSDLGDDVLYVGNSTVATLSTSMGGGKDACSFYISTVNNAQISLGDGDDSLRFDRTLVRGGTLNGGNGPSDSLLRLNGSKIFASDFGFERRT
jgi:hypothetical protein